MFETEDRNQQVNHLDQLAQDLTGNQWEGAPLEIVEFWLERVNEDLETDLPSWFDEHDKSLLEEFIEKYQGLGE